MTPEQKLAELALTLPPAPKPVAVYKPLVFVGNLVVVSGHGPLKQDKTLITGKVGTDLTLDEGKAAARQVGLAILATLRDPSARPNPAVFMEFGRYEVDHDGFGGFQPVRAAFDGRFKLVVNLLTTDEFYDLQADPNEFTNLATSTAHADVREDLVRRLSQWMEQTYDYLPPGRSNRPGANWPVIP